MNIYEAVHCFSNYIDYFDSCGMLISGERNELEQIYKTIEEYVLLNESKVF